MANELRLIPKNVLVSDSVGSVDQPCSAVSFEALLVVYKILFYD